MRQHGRVYDKKYLVLRFDVYAQMKKSKDEQKMRELRWKYAGEYTDFMIRLLNRFCSLNFTELGELYFSPANSYKKSWIFGPYDIGMDMLEEELGLIREHQWMYVYFKIPRENVDMVEFFTSQEFSFNVKTVQTI